MLEEANMKADAFFGRARHESGIPAGRAVRPKVGESWLQFRSQPTRIGRTFVPALGDPVFGRRIPGRPPPLPSLWADLTGFYGRTGS
jgi:hypothetical protein